MNLASVLLEYYTQEVKGGGFCLFLNVVCT